jgi:hypothetical protein
MITGRVTDAATQAPVAGASVVLPDLDRAAACDSAGIYVLEGVPAGPHHVTVRRLGYASRSLHAIVPRTGRLTLHVTLEAEPLRLSEVAVQALVAVRGLEPGIAGPYPDRGISSEALVHHPLLAEPDLFQALEGGEVVVRSEAAGAVNIRGGASDQTGYLIDGIPVFSPYHSAGLSAAWNPDAFARVQMWSVTRPTGAGHALSGTIEGTTRTPGDCLRGQASFTSTQARLTVDGPLGSGGAGYVLAGRTGIHDFITPNDESSYLGGGSDDWLAKLELPAAGGRVHLLGLGNSNEIDAGAEPGDPPALPRNQFDWRSRSLGGGWTRKWEGLTARLLGWRATGDAGAAWSDSVGEIGLAATRRDAGGMASIELGSGGATSALELRWEQSLTSYGVQSDSAAGPRWDAEGRTTIATAVARHAHPLPARTSLALEMSVAFKDGVPFVAPRAQLAWNPDPRVTLTATGFRTHQFAQSLRNPESVVGHIFPVDVFLGSTVPGIPVARSDQGVIAADVRPFAGVRFGVQGWMRDSEGLVLVAPADGEPFSTGPWVVGGSRGHGAALDLAISGARYGVVAAYGWQELRVEYGGTSYVPEFAAAHQAQAGVVVFPNATLSIRLGAEAAFGRRTTRIPGALDWESCNLADQGCEFAGSPHYGGEPLGATPLPDYLRLDLGARKHWHLGLGGRDAQMAVFGTVSNLLGHRNILTYARDPASGAPVEILLHPPGLLVAGIDAQF